MDVGRISPAREMRPTSITRHAARCMLFTRDFYALLFSKTISRPKTVDTLGRFIARMHNIAANRNSLGANKTIGAGGNYQ